MSESELRLYYELRAVLEAEITRRGLDDAALAALLDIEPLGAAMLRERRFDELTTCLRVADALGLEVRLVLANPDDRDEAPLGARSRLSPLAGL